MEVMRWGKDVDCTNGSWYYHQDYYYYYYYYYYY